MMRLVNFSRHPPEGRLPRLLLAILFLTASTASAQLPCDPLAQAGATRDLYCIELVVLKGDLARDRG